MSEHHFNVEEASKYGVEEAILLYNIRYWIEKNKANEKHKHNGRYWTYNSGEAFQRLFPYMTRSTISRKLKKLEEIGVLASGNFNKSGYDRTKWYSINDSSISQNDLSISQNEQPIPDNKTQIVNTNNISSNDSAKSDDLAILFSEIRDIFKLSPQYKFSIKRRNQLQTRLKEWSPDQLKVAAQNLMDSPWHSGENPSGKQYAKPDFLLKSYEKVEEWVLVEQAKSEHDLTEEEMEAIRKRQEAEVVYA